VRPLDELEEQKRHGKKPDSGKLAIHPDHPRCRSTIWICTCGHIRKVVIYSKFHRNPFKDFPFKGFGTTGCRNLPSPIDLAVGLYNSLYSTVQDMMYFCPQNFAAANCRCKAPDNRLTPGVAYDGQTADVRIIFPSALCGCH